MIEHSNHIAVIGAGIVGLSTALRVVEDVQNAEVTVIAEKFYNETTSFGAAGLWEPYQLAGTPDSLVNEWGQQAFDHFLKLYNSREAGAVGVQLLTVYQLFQNGEDTTPPSWKEIVFNYARLTSDDLRKMGLPSRFVSGASFGTLVVEQRLYLHWLYRKLEMMGVKFIQQRVESLNQLSGYKAIINCAGIGGGLFNSDPHIFPIRGQVVRVRAPWIKACYFWGTNYIIPQTESIVLGGTAQHNDWDTSNSLKNVDAIISEAASLFPALREAKEPQAWAGLRPARGTAGVRLGGELVNIGNSSNVPLVHCYGHGGAGITIGMGCANDAIQKWLLPLLKQSENTETGKYDYAGSTRPRSRL
jgi:glycine/D-amino acid oxidase-like deaminating enzyme